jgi:aminoglycoside phosphotransferase
MESGVVQISVLVGCAGVAARYITQLVVVLWSLRADDKGRQYAIELLTVLRGGPPDRRGLKEK